MNGKKWIKVGIVLVVLGFVTAIVVRPQSARKISVLGLRVGVAIAIMWGALRMTRKSQPEDNAPTPHDPSEPSEPK